MLKQFTIGLTALALSALSGSGRCDAGVVPNISQQMRKDDPRLEKTINISVHEAAIADLLEQVSNQAGAPISTSQRNGEGDAHVFASCSGVKVADFMNGLWSLMSYNGAQWVWNRSGKPGAYRYMLLQPESARKFREKLQAWVQERFETLVGKLLDASDGTPEERAAALKNIYDRPNRGGEGAPEDVLWSQVEILKDSFSPQQRLELLRSKAGTIIDIPVSALSSRCKNFISREFHDFASQSHFYRDGIEVQAPEQQSIRVSRQVQGDFPLVRVEYRSVNAAPFHIGGGENKQAYFDMLRAKWLLPTDASSNPVERKVLFLSVDAKRTSASISAHPVGQIANLLLDTAAATHAPVLARLPEDADSRNFPPLQGSLTEYWKKLELVPFMQKWREGIYLVSSTDWPFQDPPVPVAFVHALRNHAKPGEFVPFDDLTAAAGLLTESQLVRLKDEFPTMDAVRQAQGLLAFLFRRPDLATRAVTPPGILLTDDVVEAIRRLPPSPLPELIASGQARFLSIKMETDQNAKPPTRSVIFQLRDVNGKFVRGLGFSDHPQPLNSANSMGLDSGAIPVR